MPSTYTSNSGIEKPGSGEQSGTWGTTVNTNMDIIDRSVNGVKSIALTGTSSTLTTSDGLLSDGHHALLRFTGTLSGTHTVTISPSDAQKVYFVRNSTDQTVTFSQGSGSSTADVASGESGIVYADGSDECHNFTDLLAIPTAVQTELDTITANDWVTNARIATDAVNADSIAAGAVGTSELASDSVTNAKIATDAVNADSIAANVVSASELNVSGNGSTGQYLESDGDGSFSWSTPDTFPTGGIILWSGSVANIPTGWALCDGTNSTPDLRNRFVVGAGDTYSVDGTGGNNSTTLTTANLPAHTHSFSGNTSNKSLTGSASKIAETFGAFGTTSGIFSKGNSSAAGTPQNTDTSTTGVLNIDASHSHSFSGNTGSVGSGSSFDNRPAYYALAYIMKT